VTDAANILDISRQYMRKILNDARFMAPDPVHQGATVIYHFSEILKCLKEANWKNIEADLLDIAETNKKINIYKQLLGSMSSSNRETFNCISQIIPEDVKSILENTSQIVR